MARPRDPDKLHFKGVGLRQADWDYVALWSIAEITDEMPINPTVAIGQCLERLKAMAPNGPGAFAKASKPPRHRLPTWLKKYAQDHGLTRNEAAAFLVKTHKPEGY